MTGRTVYVTMHALTRGIVEAMEDARQEGIVRGTWWVKVKGRPAKLRLNRDVWDTWDDAWNDAESRRRKTIAALRKKVERLEVMTFT